MFKKISLAVLAAATAMTALPAAAEAQPRGSYYGDGPYGYSQNHYDQYDGQDYYAQGQYGQDHYSQGYYGQGHRYRPGDTYYGRGYDNRYRGRHYSRNRYYGRGYCRDSGTTGALLGAIAGGLIGHEVADGNRYHRGDGTAGAIVGSVTGALIGREIDRDC